MGILGKSGVRQSIWIRSICLTFLFLNKIGPLKSGWLRMFLKCERNGRSKWCLIFIDFQLYNNISWVFIYFFFWGGGELTFTSPAASPTCLHINLDSRRMKTQYLLRLLIFFFKEISSSFQPDSQSCLLLLNFNCFPYRLTFVLFCAHRNPCSRWCEANILARIILCSKCYCLNCNLLGFSLQAHTLPIM